MPTSTSNEIPMNGERIETTTNEEYLKMILSRASDDGSIFCEGTDAGACRKITVESVEIEGNGVIGENYGSTMTYAKVKLRTGEDVKETGIVIKNLKETPWHVEIMNIFVLFEKEVEFFKRTLPAVEQFQADRRVMRPIKELLPRCLFANTDKNKGIIITENICQQGFKMADRRRGLGLTHASLAMKALARFHAASLTMKILEPEAFWKAFKATQREAYFTEERKIIFDKLYKQISKGKLISMAKAEAEKGVSDGPSLTKMAEVGEEILRNRGKLAINMLKNYREPLAVFNHGDFWVNNFMYRYEINKQGKKSPVSMKIFDFQMTRYGSPALDIHTFLYTSTTRELRRAHEEDLLHAYHRSLLDAIYDAGIDPLLDIEYEGKAEKCREKTSVGERYDLPEEHPFSYAFLKEELKRHGPWALMIAEMMLRIVMVDSSEVADTMEATILNGTEVLEEDDKIIGYDMLQQLNTNSYCNRMFHVFRELVHKGYLENGNTEN